MYLSFVILIVFALVLGYYMIPWLLCRIADLSFLSCVILLVLGLVLDYYELQWLYARLQT